MVKMLPAILGFGLIILIIGVAVGPVASELQQNQTQTDYLSEGESTDLPGEIRLSVDKIQTSGTSNVTVSLRDTETNQTQTDTIDQGTESSFSFEDSITVRADSITSQEATLNSSYSRAYGWSGPAKTVKGELPLILVLGSGIVVFGFLFAILGGEL